MQWFSTLHTPISAKNIAKPTFALIGEALSPYSHTVHGTTTRRCPLNARGRDCHAPDRTHSNNAWCNHLFYFHNSFDLFSNPCHAFSPTVCGYLSLLSISTLSNGVPLIACCFSYPPTIYYYCDFATDGKLTRCVPEDYPRHSKEPTGARWTWLYQGHSFTVITEVAEPHRLLLMNLPWIP